MISGVGQEIFSLDRLMAKTVLQRIEGIAGASGGLSIANIILVAVVIALGVALFRGLCAVSRDGMVNQGLAPGPYPGGPVAAGPAPVGAPAPTGPPVGSTDPEQLKPPNALKVNWLRPPLLSQNPLRNANLTVREDPLIPKVDVGPFLNSTIDQSDRPGLTTCGPPAGGPGPMAATTDNHFANSYASV
jgi:hypothetical protein